MRMIRFFLMVLALLVAVPAIAQEEEDKGFLTRKIQDLLSGAGREVSISGFRGALSSAASFDRMTISDAEGIWLTLEDVVLDWNRSALLRGRLEVEELSAARIDIPRLPKSEETTLPDAEAKPFTLPKLPDLPVAVNIDAVNIAQVTLGEPVVGQSVQLQMNAQATLNDDGLDMVVNASRTDGKRGVFDITAKLERGDDVIDALLKLSEQEDGIAANLLNIPDKPSVDLTVNTTGTLDDMVTDLLIDTDGEERLAGEITLITQGNPADPDRRIVADIGGDITAVILPEYRDFFGPQVSLTADALIEASGAVAVDAFTLKAAAADLTGQVRLSDEKWPALIDVQGTVARADGAPVLLPGGGGTTTVQRIVLNVDYDVQKGEAYEAVFDISGLETEAASVAQTTVRASGTLTGASGNIGQLLGTVEFAAQGVALMDAALSEALGQQISGTTEINYLTDQPFRISNLDLQGTDYTLKGDVAIDGLASGFQTTLDAKLTASDLSRFSALAGRELDGATSLALKGSVTPLSGEFDMQANGTADDIKTGIAQADALLAGRTDLNVAAIRNQNGIFLRELELNNPAMRLTGSAELASSSSRVDGEVVLRDIATVLPQYSGAVTLKGNAVQNDIGWRVDVDADGPYETSFALDGLATGPDAALEFAARVPELSKFAEGVEGPLNAEGTVRQTPQGWLLQTDADGPYDVTARVNGLVTPSVDIGFELALPELSAVAPQVTGPLRATGRLRQTDSGFRIETEASGPYSADVSVTGALTPAVDVQFDLSVPNVQPLVPQVNGPLRATGQLRQMDEGFFVDVSASGPYGARALVEGLATGPDMSLDYDVRVPNVAPLAPGINGPLAAKGNLRQTPRGISVSTDATGPYRSRATVRGVVTGPDAAVTFNFAMPDIGAIVPKLNGQLIVNGNAGKTLQGWDIDTSMRGPAGTQATVAGLVGNDGRLNMEIEGNAPLGLAAPFIAPRSLQGQTRFDLRLDGPAGLDALSGTIQTSGATLTAPNLRTGLEGINADIRLANNRATLDITASPSGGGRLAINGGIGLTGALPADVNIALEQVVLVDPRLYRTSLSGGLRLSGPLTGGAGISGNITIGETNITVPSTGLTSIGDIPVIDHIGAPADNVATRRRAGLLEEGGASDPVERGASTQGFGLNISVNAPGRIFVRGRGLDAELGGSLQITGDTNNIISAGRFELARGRLDILGKRFNLEEGSAEFQGDLIPYIRFVSTTSTQAGTASVIVEGPADAPEVTFESNPAGPQDEVLAQLLFGRNLSEISAFQALQLANAVAVLAGRGGNGMMGNLRDRFGLDDLDVTTTDSGETALRVGKYLTDNVYTDVTAASDGTGEVSLNIDITPNLKGKATLGSDGDSSIGVFFEKDY
ncbi:translocation/assembly module TamB domain-containing protein [Sulfitobacter sp. F26169L]|uniref:translocation/assembly module TamB domain-containing protein n=1 Tax=Sulfitobacter sp. F26169L TaxID=2996015 RepID=UPI002260B49A|nr:translocation/assembly module TamB domain-containing protein [Sulfitobacter sp. F26169L]MCX7564967.1 translocation/assembly module TamB domain-containing protein [Sulfitobacter sp. F26169L]